MAPTEAIPPLLLAAALIRMGGATTFSLRCVLVIFFVLRAAAPIVAAPPPCAVAGHWMIGFAFYHARGDRAAREATWGEPSQMLSLICGQRPPPALRGPPRRRRGVSCGLARIWPPPDEDEELQDCNGETVEDVVQEEEEQGDVNELATFLLRELEAAGSSKKKLAAVRMQLLSLDVSLAATVGCLTQVCMLTPRDAAAKFARLKARTLHQLAPTAEDGGASTPEAVEADALPARRGVYDRAVGLLLEYFGEMLALSAGSTTTIFSTLAREGGSGGVRHVAPTGGTLPAAVRLQVLQLVGSVLRGDAAMSPPLLYRLLRLTKVTARDLCCDTGDGPAPPISAAIIGGYVRRAVAAGGFESVPAALVNLLECPDECYPPAAAVEDLVRRGLWSHAEQVGLFLCVYCVYCLRVSLCVLSMSVSVALVSRRAGGVCVMSCVCVYS